MVDIELYLIRHAETVMNTNPHLIGGRSNETELTAEGIEQSKRLGRYFLSNQIFPVHVYSSPAVRTLKTAEYALTEMSLDVTPLVCDSLQELSQGYAEGNLRSAVYTDTVLSEISRLGKDFKLPGGESMNEVGKRMHGWVQETFDENSTGEGPERNFVFTHGGTIKYFASHLLNWSHEQTFKTAVENASISLFIRKDGEWHLEYLNFSVD